MLRFCLFISLFLCTAFTLRGQAGYEWIEGKVTFLSSVNVYVKFKSTEGIEIGDTLFFKKENVLQAGAVLESKSSSSSVSRIFEGNVFKKGDVFFFKKKIEKEPEKEPEETKEKPIDESVEVVRTPEEDAELRQKKRAASAAERARLRRQKVRARLSAASYSNFSESGPQTQMRYAFVLQGNNIKNSRFSTDNYIVYRHSLEEKTDFNFALKIYSLSAKYDFSENTNITIGRRINPRISSLGAVDGLQFEKGFGPRFKVGLIGGSRPNVRDYSVDFNLMQGGLFLGLDGKNKDKYRQTTLAFLEQRNGGAVDRRFAYLQHSGELLENLNAFASMEVDLYEKVQNEVKNGAKLTNLFASLRYRVNKNFSINGSYDNRKNTIFYESYQSQIDQLIDQETRQGLRLGFNLRPTKRINVGLHSGWRFQKSDLNLAKNLNAYVSFNNIPKIKTNISFSANLLESNYQIAQNYGLRMMRNFWKDKIGADVYYRNVNYTNKTTKLKTNQQLVGASLSWRFFKNLSFYLYGENTFDGGGNDFLRVNGKVMQRF